ERQDYIRDKVREHRAKKADVNKCKQDDDIVNIVNSVNTSAHLNSSQNLKTKSSHERYASRIKLVTTTYTWEGITEEDRNQWRKSFPAVNLDIELAKAAGYIKANPSKIKKNWSRYLFNWFCRVQDRGGQTASVSRPQNGYSPQQTPSR